MRITGTLHEDQYTYLAQFFLEWDVTDKCFSWNQNTHFEVQEFIFEHCALYETNIVEPDRPQMTVWRMRIAYWTPKATNTHTVGA